VKPVERVLEGLEGVRRNGNGWKALCPAHDDHEPSLSVSVGRDGRALVNCFKGDEGI
jgi:putative DNA primase/helicase